MGLVYHLHDRMPYSRRRNPRYPLNRRLDGPQSRSGLCEAEQNFLPLPGTEATEQTKLDISIVACIMVTRQVTGNSIYLGFHLAELQLFVTHS
jgi:hypothetical protein